MSRLGAAITMVTTTVAAVRTRGQGSDPQDALMVLLCLPHHTGKTLDLTKYICFIFISILVLDKSNNLTFSISSGIGASCWLVKSNSYSLPNRNGLVRARCAAPQQVQWHHIHPFTLKF